MSLKNKIAYVCKFVSFCSKFKKTSRNVMAHYIRILFSTSVV